MAVTSITTVDPCDLNSNCDWWISILKKNLHVCFLIGPPAGNKIKDNPLQSLKAAETW